MWRRRDVRRFRTDAIDAALKGYSGEKAQFYIGLKLWGMQEAPVQLAVFCDDTLPIEVR